MEMPAILGLLVLFAVALGLIYLIGSLMLMHQMLFPPRKTYATVLGRGLPTGPEEVGLAGRETLFRFQDGQTSPGWIVQGENPQGPLIILTHGWANSRYGSLAKAARMARWAKRVVIYDLRGHGDSSAKHCQMGVMESKDLREVMDQSQQTPDEPIVLVGSSMGAGITLEAALDDQASPPPPPPEVPPEVACQASCHIPAHVTPGNPASQQVPPSTSRVVGVLLEGAYRFVMAPVAAHLHQRRLPAQPFCLLARWGLRWMLGPGIGHDRARQAASLRCSMLMIHGSEDPICRIEVARQIARACPNSQLVEIQGGQHGGLPLVDPQTYDEAVQNWLSKLPRISVPAL